MSIDLLVHIPSTQITLINKMVSHTSDARRAHAKANAPTKRLDGSSTHHPRSMKAPTFNAPLNTQQNPARIPWNKGKKPPQFSFLKLPPEIRNMIYKYIVPMDSIVVIRAVLPDEHEEIMRHGVLTRACLVSGVAEETGTTYTLSRPVLTRTSSYAIRIREQYPFTELDGSAGTRSSVDSIGSITPIDPTGFKTFTGILGTNKHMRTELLRMFYTTNTFHFEDWRTVMPFLTDRTPEALTLIKSFSMSLGMTVPRDQDPNDGKSSVAWDLDINKEWGNVLAKVAKFKGLRLEKLHLRDTIFMSELNGSQGYNYWIKKRYGPALSNLKELSLDITCEDINDDEERMDWGLEVDDIEAGIRAIKEDVWSKLAPVMLKKVD